MTRSWCALRAVRAAPYFLGLGLGYRLVVEFLSTSISRVLLSHIGIVGRILGRVVCGLVLLLSPLGLRLLLLRDECLGLGSLGRCRSRKARCLLDIAAVLRPFKAEEVGDIGESDDKEKKRDSTDAGYG